MSGSTIGGIAGGVIGWFVGGPAGAQWGWMIGSMAGAILMPEQFEGPRLNEAKTQTASDGVPLIYGYGTFPCAGNLTWVDEVKEHRKKESAKGGPETITYTYTVSYMIVVCKGEISGYKLIKRNGKIVYDARTDAELSALGYTSNEIAETRANQAAFLQRATLYYGTQTQMPDPTMVAVEGAGNVPAYTGIAYIVLKDDETREGEVSQYEFVVANCGDRTEDATTPTEILVTGAAGNGQPQWSKAMVSSEPSFTAIPWEDGANVSNGFPAYYGGTYSVTGASAARYSTDLLDTIDDGVAAWTTNRPLQVVGGPAGWLGLRPYTSAGYIFSADGVASNWQPYTNHPTQFNNIHRTGLYYYGSALRSLYRSDDLVNWELISQGKSIPSEDWRNAIQHWIDIVEMPDGIYAAVKRGWSLSNETWEIRRSRDGGVTWPDMMLQRSSINTAPVELCAVGSLVVAFASGGGVWTSANGFSALVDTGLSGRSVTSLPPHYVPAGRQLGYSDGFLYLIGSGSDGDKIKVSSDAGITWSDAIPLPVGGAYGITIGSAFDVFGLVPIPDAPGHYINRETGEVVGPSGTQVDLCQPSLGEIVSDQCERRGVTSRDVSELDDPVGGYRVAAPSTPQKNIQGLQPGYFFGASEFDGTLHFPKRGRDLTFALTHDDFVERDGDPIQWERTQEPELLRKVTVGYVDPDTTYTATTQMAERRAATISAEGESTIELAVTGSKDWAAQAADKALRVAWGEPDECTFHVSIEHAELVTGAEGTVPYMDGTDTAIRIDRIEDEGLVRMVTGRRTRANLYLSNASGIAKQLPRFPGSSMRGPTDGVLINIPVLVDSNDVPGIHWAASGMLSGWQGCVLQILRAGQWLTAGTITTAAAMGRLVAPLPYHAGDIDTANVVRLKINDSLESVSFFNLLQERNPMAIMRVDGTAEIIQFQSAVEVSAGEFELTTLLRNRLDSGSSSHDAGARVVLLDSRVMYAPLELSDIGQALTYRFVSLGTDPDAAEVLTLDLDMMESQREWPVFDLDVEVGGDDFILSWRKRDRLGTDVLPIRSTHWGGYQVSYSHSGGSGTVVVTTESHTFTLPGASDITFSVSQLNQFTGAGPSETVHIP